MKPLAIHHQERSFSDRWLEACEERSIPFEVVNCFDVDIIAQLRDKSALLWHFAHGFARDLMIARHVLKAAASMGLVTFPDEATCWHFDDKVAQKYALEAIDAPLMPTWVFYDLETALAWIDRAEFPKVFKLRRGSGSRNVRLARDRAAARKLAEAAFGRGFTPSGSIGTEAWKLGNAWRKGQIVDLLRSLPAKLARRRELDQRMGRESGYLYLQEFAADNAFDTRVTVIGDRAFAFTRDVRPHDFRASGSGRIVYDPARIKSECVRTAFSVAGRLRSQSVCFDFVDDGTEQPRIVEISYGYEPRPVYDCPGHWDPELRWVAGHLWPEHAILDDVLARIAAGSR